MKPPDSPLPVPYLTAVAKNIFGPLQQHDCSTCLFVSGGGKRTIVQWILGKPEVLQAAVEKELERMLFVYVDPDNLLTLSNEAYLDLIHHALTDEAGKKKIRMPASGGHTSLERLKQSVGSVVDAGWNVVFILHDFGVTLQLSASIYLNLETIMAVNKSHVMYVVLSSRNLLDQNILKVLHNFKYAVSQHVSYYPLLAAGEIDYFFQRLERNGHTRYPVLVKKTLTDLCGGHPQLLKYAAYTLSKADELSKQNESKIRELLFGDEQLAMVCADIWERLSVQERESIVSVVRNGTLAGSVKSHEYLLQTRIIVPEGTKYRVFGQLFSWFVRRHIPKEELLYDSKTNQLTYGERSCTQLFTPQEFSLLTHFITHRGDVLTRDDVGQVLWGKDYFEKYSEQMIDKIISTLRKKLDVIGFPSEKLVTLKKRGFYLTK